MTSPIRLAAALAVAIAIGLLWSGLGESRRPGAALSTSALRSLPAAPAPALEVGPPARLTSSRFLSRWAIVRSPALARSAPSASAPGVAGLKAKTAEQTPSAVGVLSSKADRLGGVWVKVQLPILPNSSVGWVKRRALGAYHTVDTRLLVDRRTLRATLYRAGKRIFSASVGVGTSASPTPAGHFIVRSELTRYASAFYGPIAFGTTARSAVLTDWPGGGFVGIHGTDAPQLLPGQVSHGCIRMRNADIRRLAKLMPIGTPLTIR